MGPGDAKHPLAGRRRVINGKILFTVDPRYVWSQARSVPGYLHGLHELVDIAAHRH